MFNPLSALRTLLLLSSLTLMASGALAASSVLIWPINPTLSAEQKARPLWLENQANVPATLQIRIFRWQQRDQGNDYQPQDDVLPSPPVVTIAPGDRQLVRLTLTGAAPGTGEDAYRILVDEIPDVASDRRPANSRVQFRMRYSVPLFVTSPAVPEDTERADRSLNWEIVKEGGKRYLRIHNEGPVHVRLTRVHMDQVTLAEGLLGYVLAHASRQWPLPDNVRAGQTLKATVNAAEPVVLRHVGS
ncbi:fimbrial chaperone protein [Kushneria avicenniae]|uniref:Fimbrial chaperone protein n=1 Tax=Kushneria avicenniae TaxID=402385 RepID=A0A1I1LSQ3_9GAMM|nr:molecular chaperone [Kushneria avicenniae]SFC72490.1 fimbrial chaperone protein [Kushneria avicenniae]